ncbi:MAG: putative sterol carrier protein [Cyanobacteria bacterium RYN_339]|nr:putative sterol carrier protein [Cyanobacteria bacterium RYN_339]
MAHEFLSDAWLADLTERLKTSEAFKKATKDWKTTITFALLADEAKGVQPVGVVLELDKGECKGATRVAGPGPYDGDYVIRGVADNWKKLLTKEIFPVPALMSQQLQLVKGSSTSLMMKMGATQGLLDEAGAVPTNWG